MQSPFTLADITDVEPFRRLGTSLAVNPDSELSRTLVSARVLTGPDGMKRTELVTSTAADRVSSTPRLLPEGDLRAQLTELVLASSAVPTRKDQRAQLAPILDAFFEGLGAAGIEVLSANLDRAGARLVRLVEQEQRHFMAKPTFDEIVEIREFNPARATDKSVSADRFGPFSKSLAYEGWQRSLYLLEWFDTTPERTVANMVDADKGVTCWVRLHRGELPIPWAEGHEYNPDLLVVETDRTHWIVEPKMDKGMASSDVQGKKRAAEKWANIVNADPSVGATWRYLLVSQNINTAKDSWPALKKLGGWHLSASSARLPNR